MRLKLFGAKLTVMLLIGLSLGTCVPGVFAATAKTAAVSPASYDYMRVFYYKEGKNAEDSLFAHPKSIDILAPQEYSFDENGQLQGGLNPDVVAFAKANNIDLMPVVVNDGFSQASFQNLLNDTGKQDAAIQMLINEAKTYGYWGWQFDFEQMDLSYRDKYSAFVARAHEAFKQQNLVLSVAVIAQVSENPSDYVKDLWNRIIGVYDYASLASNSDFISLMSYDDPVSTGPIARYSWLKQVLAFSLKSIPPEKLSLGIGLYYWKWDIATGKRVGIGGYEGLQTALARKGAVVGYSSVEKAPYVKYTVNKSKYTIWYENGKSVSQKLALISSYGLHGFSAWALGLEAPSVLAAVAR